MHRRPPPLQPVTSDMRVRWCCAGIVLAALTACSSKVVRVDMDTSRLAVSAPHAVPLACKYRLQDVVDARADGGRAGGLSQHAFQFTDAAATVRKQLLAAGLSADVAADAPAVRVDIMQLYLAQNLGTKIPVAVYQVAVADDPAFVLRSQKASMNWNGTQDEAYAAYARVMADVNQQLVTRLNTRCAVD